MGIQMNWEKRNKTFMMMSNFKNPLVSEVFVKRISSLRASFAKLACILIQIIQIQYNLVPDHLNKRTTSRLGPLLSSPKVFSIDVMLKD